MRVSCTYKLYDGVVIPCPECGGKGYIQFQRPSDVVMEICAPPPCQICKGKKLVKIKLEPVEIK